MAAITPDTVDPGVVANGGEPGEVQGLRHQVVSFITQTIDNTDTWTLDGEQVVVRMAWEGEVTADVCQLGFITPRTMPLMSGGWP